MNVVKICDHCGKTGDSLLKCSQCKISYYCNTVCQKKEWKQHASMCRRSATFPNHILGTTSKVLSSMFVEYYAMALKTYNERESTECDASSRSTGSQQIIRLPKYTCQMIAVDKDLFECKEFVKKAESVTTLTSPEEHTKYMSQITELSQIIGNKNYKISTDICMFDKFADLSAELIKKSRIGSDKLVNTIEKDLISCGIDVTDAIPQSSNQKSINIVVLVMDGAVIHVSIK